jgi:hypothetical protein
MASAVSSPPWFVASVSAPTRSPSSSQHRPTSSVSLSQFSSPDTPIARRSAAFNCISIVGFIISVATLNTAARYTAALLYTSGSFPANALVYTWAVSSLSCTPGKRPTSGAIVNIYGHLGNVMSPYFLPDSDSPRYTMAMILQIVSIGLPFCIVFGSKMYLKRQNKKLKNMSDDTGGVHNPHTM